MTRARIDLALVVAVAACSKPPAQQSPPVPVQVAAVSRVSAPLTIEANGVVEPLHTVAVAAQVGGNLESVGFNEGDDVRAGQVLFKIDPRPFEAALRQAEATLARDTAQAQNAARDAERYRALVEKDYVTRSQADQAAAAAAAAQATVQSDRAAVDNARVNLGYTTIRSPIDGRTGRLLVKAGNLVRPNGSDPLVVINQLRPILVRFPVVQKDFPAIQRRNTRGPVPVRVVTADSGRVAEAGTLAFLDNAVDSLTGTVTAKARFQNQSNALWPGEYVRVSVELQVEPNVVAVPTRAVLAGQQGNYVFVIGNDKRATVRPVSVGRAVGDLTTVDKGLEAGEQVVVDGQSRLTPNARVDAKPAPVNAGRTTQAGGTDSVGGVGVGVGVGVKAGTS
ncbi:MAG TPA: efflux RND transporter periplasmic adaptor subunit [Gemmatimonadaceae bacterium]|nr:efflux RND transporter periplasmic adaptor subunit [Gemmatimonadaceae bacterium]